MTPRVRRTFWSLVVVAVAATGALSRALAARPGPATGLAVAGSAVLLAASASLALRILVVVGRRGTGRERSGGSG
ncbi:hypothetical protein [Actinomarinicola tropica]|uniref:Uncharacterized protein n=1 Tax=Actinomarinicola tropica TaxID=2789776 RepID=A0A5Q2REN4_9ACTN|nr:hypothetical protein [Actinomarinicola tropica]QGG94113.1 hypothetical protein GH723_02795 [Actinomarinicola tropica]